MKGGAPEITAADVETALTAELGRRLVSKDPEEGRIRVLFPGCEDFIEVELCEEPAPHLEIDVPVADELDWSLRGLSSFLFREGQRLVYGRLQRRGKGFGFSHALPAGTTSRDLGEIVVLMADAAIALRGDLRAARALPLYGPTKDRETNEEGE